MKQKDLDLLLIQTPNLEELPYLVGVAALKGFLRGRGHRVEAINPVAPLIGLLSPLRTRELARFFATGSDSAASAAGALPAPLLEAIVAGLAKKISSSRPRYIGFSLIFGNLNNTFLLAGELKKLFPGTPFMAGGPGLRLRGQRERLEQVFDLYVAGEAEDALGELLSLPATDAGSEERLAAIGGLSFRKKSGEWLRRDALPPRASLEGLPQPDYSGFSGDWAARRFFFTKPLTLGRGCPFACRFCAVRGHGGSYRHYGVAECLDYVRREARWGRGSFFVHDPVVNGDLDWLLEFSRALALQNPGVRWGGNLRLDPRLLEKDALALLVSRGFRKAVIGLESFSPSVLGHMRKLSDVAAIQAIFDELARLKRRYGMRIGIQLIAGYPNETEEDFRMTLDFVKRNRETLTAVDSCSAFLLIGDDNEEMAGMLARGEFGVTARGISDWSSAHSTPGIRLDRIRRAEELFRELRLPYRVYYKKELERLVAGPAAG